MPIGASVHSAQLAEIRLAEATLRTVRVPRFRRSRTRPLVVDKGHDSEVFRWLGRFRRLVVRYERRLEVYWAFVVLAFILICLDRILK
ncbi:MAG: hypothetical protein ACP5JD_07450 [Candidatus Bipolaricaulaceae bacterium]